MTAQQTSFGDLLRRFRLAAGLSQELLAERSGLSARGISDLERGVRNTPRAETVDRLAAALGLADDNRDLLAATVRRARESFATAPLPRIAPQPETAVGAVSAHNLPTQLTSFVGRERELAAVQRHLARHRLVTLTGAGGTGKTRLALHTAAALLDRFSDGVWLVELAPLTDPARVPDAVAGVLGVREEVGRSLTAKLVAAVRDRALLLVLDNCEHLIDACATFVDALLRGSTGPSVLATSREGLGIAGEHAFRVPSLSLPPLGAWEHTDGPGSSPEVPPEVGASEAVRLFQERAQAVQPTFRLGHQNAQAVVNVCRRLDGIPLALELAAARVRVLSVEGIAARLDDRFRLLTGGIRTALPRHQTLRALIDWSYHLLRDPEQQLLRSLSVFAGGWTLEAAEAVGATAPTEAFEVLDLLSRLVDKSLVIVVDESTGNGHTGAVRYRLLETVRQYARDRLLEAGEDEAVHRRHLAWFADLASAWRRRSAEFSVHQLRELDPELGNFRAAIEFGLGGADPHAALQLVGDLHWFWLASGLMYEGRRWAARALAAQPADASPDAALVRALETRGSFEWRQGEYGVARETLTEAVALGRVVGDEVALQDAQLALTGALRDLGALAEARRVAEEVFARAERHGRHINTAQAALELGFVSILEGKADEAATWLTLAERLGRQLHWVRLNHVLRALGMLESLRDNYELACQHIEEALALARVANERPGIAYSLQELGIACLAAGDLAGAERAFTDGLPPTRELGRQSGHMIILLGLAEASRRRRDASAMGRHLAEAQGLLVSETSALRPGGVLADPVVRAHWLSAVASLLALNGASQSAARLLGAIAAHRPPSHLPQRPLQLAPRLWLAREGDLGSALRLELGEASFALAFAAGRALPLDAAIAEASQLLAEVHPQR